MTSIDPRRLTKEMKEIQGMIMDPPRVRSRVVDVLEFFSDRTRRSRTSIRSRDVGKKFGVPTPVFRALERALKESILENPEYASELSEELWKIDYREPKLLAIALQDPIPFDALLPRVEKWSQTTGDYEILAALAEILVKQWRVEGFRDFSEIVTHWLKSRRSESKIFSLLTLRFTSLESEFEDVPLIFNLIRIHVTSNDQPVRRAYLDLLRSLVHRSSSETIRYLLDVYEGQEGKGRRLVKELLADFSVEDQKKIQQIFTV